MASNLIARDAVSFASDPIGTPDDVAPQLRRTRIWEFGTTLHCSIVGTCLSTAELRHVLEKLKVDGAAEATDHELHSLGVMMASRPGEGARFLQKALDRRHRGAIFRFAKIKDAAGLLELWDEFLKQGDIPGAYWASLTHPAATQDVAKRVFADVHMLSHLVGAANRADIRRLQQLQADNAALAAKLERQQRRLHEGFVERDRKIRERDEALARQAGERNEWRAALQAGADDKGCDIGDLTRRLEQETARRERCEQRLAELSAAAANTERALHESRIECESNRHEIDELQRQLAALLAPDGEAAAPAVDLSGLTLLYVGGRAHQIPQFKAMTERAGGRFLHHDGGLEHSAGLLPGLVSRADRVLFPIDCISHDAVVNIKRHCRLSDKTYEALRTASLACLLSALARMSGCRETIAAE